MSHPYSERWTWNLANKGLLLRETDISPLEINKISSVYQSHVSFEINMGTKRDG